MAFFEGALRPVVAYILMRTTINEYRRKAKLYCGNKFKLGWNDEIRLRGVYLNPKSVYVT